MRILVLGSGAREHAIITSLLSEEAGHEITAAPGNAGISAQVETVALDPSNGAVVAQYAADNGIQAQDGAALLKLIGQRAPEQQAALLAVAYEGEYWRPTCASCGTKMVERTSGKFARPFWGCANYPGCRGRAIPKARRVEA